MLLPVPMAVFCTLSTKLTKISFASLRSGSAGIEAGGRPLGARGAVASCLGVIKSPLLSDMTMLFGDVTGGDGNSRVKSEERGDVG